MNYQNPELVEQLAAEYVLGTLRGLARRRFQRLADANPAVLATTLRWEDNLATLARTSTPVQPSPDVWRSLQSRLAAADGVGIPLRSHRRAWRFALAAGLVAIALVTGLLVRDRLVALQPVAALGADAAHPVWEVERQREYSTLRIRVVGTVERRAGRSYELWALPAGGAPVSLGLLPEAGSLDRALTPAQRAALLASKKIAVSVEPELGSPTGSPTGPVIIVRDVVRAG